MVGGDRWGVATGRWRCWLIRIHGQDYGAKNSNHWCAHGPGGEPARRGHGAVGAARGRIASAHQAIGASSGGHREYFREASGRDVLRGEAREVSGGNRRRLQGFGRDSGEIAGRSHAAGSFGRRSFDCGGDNVRGWGALQEERKESVVELGG